MSTPVAGGPQTQAHEPCAACGAPLSPDQRYCLNCGDVREGARRPMPAPLRGSIQASGDGAVPPAPSPGNPPSIAAVLAGLACLLLAMGVGVLIGRGGAADPPAQAPITIAAAGSASPAGAASASAASFTSDWPAGTDGWTVALALLPKASTTPAAVAEAKTAATGKGAAAVGALDADAFPSLTGGSYVVYSGVFDSEPAATKALASLTAAFPGARVVQVGQGAAAPPAASASSKGTSTTAAAGSSATKKDAPATKSDDTTKEFEKSKKAPKTVGTGGKPPPKDNKPAAGGGDFEEIK